MRSALARHDEIISLIVEEHNGTVVKSRGEGDSFFVVFASAIGIAVTLVVLKNMDTRV